jgi:hypothetical protein
MMAAKGLSTVSRGSFGRQQAADKLYRINLLKTKVNLHGQAQNSKFL